MGRSATINPSDLDRVIHAAQIDVETRCIREGMPWGTNGAYSGTPAAGASPVFSAVNPAFGQAAFIQTITFGASRACDVRLQIQFGNSATIAFGAGEISFYYPGSGVLAIPYKAILPANGFIQGVLNGESGSDAIKLRIGVAGYRIADDLNFEAKKVMMMVGDSIQATGPANGSYRDALAYWKVRDYLRSLGKDYRVVVKQVGGTTSSHAELWRKYGYLDIPQCDLILYQMGANDPGQGINQATYEANWLAFANWALLRWPQCKIVFLGPTPNENTGTEMSLATVRSDMSAWVTELANPRVKYLNLGTAFDRLVAANYTTSDTPGGRVHPSNLGNQAIFDNCHKPFIDANTGWL